MWRFALVLITLIANLGYVGLKIAGDVRARRWAAVLFGTFCTIGIYAIIVGGIYLSIQSSTDL